MRRCIMKKRIFIYSTLISLICLCFSHAFIAGAYGTNTKAIKNTPTKASKTNTIKVKKIILPKIVSIEDINTDVLKGNTYVMPSTISAKLSDGNEKDFPIKWLTNSLDTTIPGTHIAIGRVTGYSKNINLSLIVKEISKIEDLTGIIQDYKELQLPSTIEATLSDDSTRTFDISWDIDNPQKPEFGTYVYSGTVSGYEPKVKYTLNRKLPDKVQDIINKTIKPGMTDNEKELALHDYLIANTTYDAGGDEHKDAFADYGVIVNGKGSYYAQAFSRLLTAVGIENQVIKGEVKNNDQWLASNWNLVKLDGEYYHVDTLWDDPLEDKSTKTIGHDYFNLNDSKISIDHRWDKSLYPPCNSTKYWYFLKTDSEINDKVDAIIAAVIKPGMTDYEKELAIHDYIIMNTTFNNSPSIYSGEFLDYDVLVNAKGSAYNKAFNRLINALGIECTKINGEIKIKDTWTNTSWNLVKLDGDYYHVDTVWDSVTIDNGESAISHQSFNAEDKSISLDHKWNQAQYPPCVSEKYDITTKRQEQVNVKVSQILASIITPNMRDVDKEIAIHDYVVNNVAYDDASLSTAKNKTRYDNDDVNTAYAALIKGKSMCEGYAEAINQLLTAAGVESIIITGDAGTDTDGWDSHAWNLVKLDGEYYQLDATWDDPVLKSGGQVLHHSYFNLTDSQIQKNHKWDASKFPQATGTKYSQGNLTLTEKDEFGDIITSISNKDTYYNLLTTSIRNNQTKVFVKILNYTEDYKDLIQRALDTSSARHCNYTYYDDAFGSRYITLEFTY